MSHEGIGVTEGGGPHGKKVTFWKFLKSYVNIRKRGINVQRRTVLDMQHTVWYYDDFLGDVLRDEWNAFTSGSGTAAVVSAVNGKAQLDNTSSEDDSGLDWGAFFNWDPTLNCVMEWKCEVNTIANLNVKMGLYKDADEYAWFHVDDADNNIDYAASKNGGAGAVDSDSGIDIDADPHIFTIECFDDGSVKFYIDNVRVGTAPAATLSATPGVLHKPYFLVTDKAGQTTQHLFDIDYVFIYQDRT